jgi:hypothetical protein
MACARQASRNNRLLSDADLNGQDLLTGTEVRGSWRYRHWTQARNRDLSQKLRAFDSAASRVESILVDSDRRGARMAPRLPPAVL